MSEQQQQTPGGGRLFDRILDLGQALSRTVMVGAEPEPPRASPGRERSSSAPQESATGALAPLGDHGAGPPESSSDGRPNSAQRREGTSVATSPPTKEYCVAAGDTLAGVALRFGTTMKVLCRLNGVVGDHALLPGQRLRVPVSEPPPAESGPAAPPAGAGAHRSRNSPSSPPSATDDALRAVDGTGTTVPRVIRADAQFCAAEANVRGMITLTPVMLAFEPSRTDPTSRARGSLHFQFAIDTADIVRCGAVTHLGPDAAPAAPATPQSSPLSDRDDAAAAWGAGSGKRATAEDSASQSPADTRTAFLQVDLPVGAVDRGTAPPAHGASPDAGAPSGERRPPRPLTSARRWSKRLGGSSKATAGPAPSPPAAASDLGGESAHAEPAAQSSSSSSSSALYDSQRVLTVFFLVAGADVELLVNALCASSERRRRERTWLRGQSIAPPPPPSPIPHTRCVPPRQASARPSPTASRSRGEQLRSSARPLSPSLWPEHPSMRATPLSAPTPAPAPPRRTRRARRRLRDTLGRLPQPAAVPGGGARLCLHARSSPWAPSSGAPQGPTQRKGRRTRQQQRRPQRPPPRRVVAAKCRPSSPPWTLPTRRRRRWPRERRVAG